MTEVFIDLLRHRAKVVGKIFDLYLDSGNLYVTKCMSLGHELCLTRQRDTSREYQQSALPNMWPG